MKKFTDVRRMPSDGNTSHGPGELKNDEKRAITNLAGSIYVGSSIKLLHLVPFGQQTWPPRLILFSSPDPKGHVRYCHHLASVVHPSSTNQKQEFPWRSYLLVERNEMEKIYRGPYIDAYCQVWFHLAKLFQRRRLKYEKVHV
jgi:hypothetical protein